MATQKNLGPFRIRPRGEYDDTANYRFLDLVSFNGGSYLCSNYDTIDGTSCIGVSPEDTDYWMNIAERGETGTYEMAYHTIKDLELNNSDEYIWDFNETDKVRINGVDTNVEEKLIIENVEDGYCGALLTRKSDIKLPTNSDYSIDFNYTTVINANQYYLYTFIYTDMGAGGKFIWNRTVING